VTTPAVASAQHRSAATLLRPTEDLANDWATWLREAVDPSWRMGEWDSASLMFTGDVANPRTATRICKVSGCGLFHEGRLLCDNCGARARKSSLSQAEFIATPRPARNRWMHCDPGPCLTPSCRRARSSRGLCVAHYQGWIKVRDRIELEHWALTQRPYERLPACIVRGCQKERQQHQRMLCQAHDRGWTTACREAEILASDEAALAHWVEHSIPFLGSNQFSLSPVAAIVRLEMLFALQQRDARLQTLRPSAVRTLVNRMGAVPSIALAGDGFPDLGVSRHPNAASFLKEARRDLGAGFEKFRGIDPSQRLSWNLMALGTHMPSALTASGKRRNAGEVDFAPVRQEWLRNALMHWARTASPLSREVHKRVMACTIASQALFRRPGGGVDPSALRYADMNAVVQGFHLARRQDGEIASTAYQATLLNAFFAVLEFGRLDGVLDELSGTFVRHASHTIKQVEENEDEIGKALPESVIRQLDENVHLLGDGMAYGSLDPDVVRAMFTTAYEIIKITGRRPKEIAGLTLECLEYDQGDYQLIWDNTKGRRLRRRLPAEPELVDAIKAWKKIRSGLEVPKFTRGFLFPPISDTGAYRHMNPQYISATFRAWVDSIPVLSSEELGEDGAPLPFDRSRIFPYAFRHSFCQRYADAGMPQHVLQALMDHKSGQTTAAYYRVTNKMKREAMNVLRLHTTDRHGGAAPMSSTAAYEMRSVAVPFGNCVEPANVKAGGRACPVRFQCSGCPSYRPDPSHLPAIEDQVRSLRANLEVAVTMGAASYTIQGMEGEIADYKVVIAKMTEKLAGMSDEERHEVEEASRTLRRLRAGASSSSVALPMPTFRRPGHEEGS
jgi:integrase